MLKVRNISSSATRPPRGIRRKSGGTSQDPRRTRAPRPAGQHPGDVAGEAAAGDVGEGAHLVALEERLEGREVARGGGRGAPRPRSRRAPAAAVSTRVAHEVEEDLARQGVAVRVQPRGGQAEEHVALGHAPRQGLVLLHHPHDEARRGRSRPGRRSRASRRSRRR